MKAPEARLKLSGETSRKKPVMGLRPIKERNQRSEALIEEQFLSMKETQRMLHEALENLERALTEEEFEKGEEALQELFHKSEELLVIVQVMMKIRNELAYARLDLERAIKGDCGVEKAKKRVKWLQDRLEKVLLTARSYCYLHRRMSKRSKTPESGLKDQISEKLWNKLSRGQQDMLLESEKKSRLPDVDETVVTPIVKEVAKMQLPQTESTESIIGELQDRDVEAKEEAVGVVSEGSQLPADEGLPKEKWKKSDGPKGSRDETELSALAETFPPQRRGGYLSDLESTASAEPQSEVTLEEDDDRRSESILSSVGALELDEVGSDVKSAVIVEVTSHSEEYRVGSSEPKGSTGDRVLIIGEEVILNEEDDDMNDDHGNDDDSQDMVAEYWSSDHHKFDWSGYMQNLDPLSWHSLGLSVPESFLSKERPNFEPELPWKEKPMKVNSVIDVHKIALDKLLLRLHKMYESISQATQSTIDHARIDEKIETVMGKLELEVDQVPGSAMEKRQSSEPLISKQVSHVSLPQIRSPVARQKSFISMEKYPVTIHKPTATRTTRQNRRKLYPQHSLAWCGQTEVGHRMPQIIQAKPKPKLQKRKSVVQSRYKNLPKQESSKNEPQSSEVDLSKTPEWKAAMLIRVVTAFKGFNSEGPLMDRESPKWKRIETLLGEDGLMSPNATIAAESAKALGLLKCREKDVVDTLSHVIKLHGNAKVCYEASKALILLGTWDPHAMTVITQYIKLGNKDIVVELLSTMTKARDIAFVDKSTTEFKEMVNLLIFTIKTQSPELAFHAAVSLGRLCVVEPVSKSYLISRLPDLTSSDKGEALYVLIKQMNCKEMLVIDALLEQLSTAYNWKLRLEAADLLIYIGAGDMFKVKSPEQVFDILETLLWDHANKELRAKVSEVLSSLDLRQKANQLILRRLEDSAEEVRARAVISLGTLKMKGVKEMKALLDILELDSSVYVRIQVVRAFGNMEWSDPRILRSLREREKGEGTLAKEARKALAYLSRFPTMK